MCSDNKFDLFHHSKTNSLPIVLLLQGVDKFVKALKIVKWSIVDAPSNETVENIYNINQEDTVKFGKSKSDKKNLNK